MSCPEFAGRGALLREGGCAWVKPIGRVTNQWGGNSGPDFTLSSAGTALGGQLQIAQLLALDGVDLRAQYDGEIAGNMISHSGQLAVAIHFRAATRSHLIVRVKYAAF